MKETQIDEYEYDERVRKPKQESSCIAICIAINSENPSCQLLYGTKPLKYVKVADPQLGL